MQKYNAKLTPLIREEGGMSIRLKTKLATLLGGCLVFILMASSMYAIADTVSNSEITPIAKVREAESLTTDTGVQNLTMVDGIDRFKRNYFLKKASINMQGWIDDRRILARAFDEPYNRAHPGLEPRAWVVIDTETGAIERMPWNTNTEVKCLNNGRIILWEHPSGDWRSPETWYVGKFGGAMTTYRVEADATGHHGLPKEWKEQGLLFDGNSCRLVKIFQKQKQSEQISAEYLPSGHTSSRMVVVRYLEIGDGWLVETSPWRSNNPPNPSVSDYLLIKEDGSRMVIPTTAGERSFSAPAYLGFADGYFTYPELHFGDPQHVWSPHFARLIHPDGRVERFPIPGPLMDQIVNHHEGVGARYTRSGPLWKLNVHGSIRNSDRLLGSYLVIGQELVRVAQRIFYVTSPDGCKLAGESEQSWQQMNDLSRINDPRDYFVINLCKE